MANKEAYKNVNPENLFKKGSSGKPKGSIHGETIVKNRLRKDIPRILMNMPLSVFISYNKNLKDFIEEKFGASINKMSVEDAIEYTMIASFLVKPDPRSYEMIKAELYGRLKEETNKDIKIELPTFNDPIALIEQIPTEHLARILEERKAVLVESSVTNQ